LAINFFKIGIASFIDQPVVDECILKGLIESDPRYIRIGVKLPVATPMPIPYLDIGLQEFLPFVAFAF
jgi:hypothetical protein